MVKFINTSLNKLLRHAARGALLIHLIVFGSIGIVIIGGLVQWSIGQNRLARQRSLREMAFEIAEAGVDYYRWHLAHAPNDFQDGTGSTGPYVHIFNNRAGEQIGTFTLTITPPPTGSTMVIVESSGVTLESPHAERVIRARFAIPSLAKFAIAANADMRFGEGTEVFGPTHSNGGIRFDGLAHNLITSARTSYDDPDHSGANEFGVHTHDAPTDPLPPAAAPNRTDIFMAGRQFPVPAVDFTGIINDLADIKTQAQASNGYYSSSGALGYHVTLQSNDTYILKRVNSLQSPPQWCTNQLGQSGWGTWSIGTGGSAQTTLGTHPFPSANVLFFEDHLWIDGQISSARLTIASGKFPENPSTNTSITINNDIIYSAYDGSAVLGLIAQNNINVGLSSENDIRIDAALVAKNGRIGRYYYWTTCGSSYIRSQITLWGMLATNQRYGFAYTDGTGYQTRNITYDASLLYAPPPSFPLTSDQYTLLSWEEVK